MRRAARAGQADVGIGTLAAASRTAGADRENRYSITLASAAEAPREVTLVFDVYGVDGAGAAGRHVAYALKRLRLSPRGALRVDVRHRWRAAAEFEVEGAREPADELWVGDPAAGERVSVVAELRDAAGRAVDRTVIYQDVDEGAPELHESPGPGA
jgi:hypothetical protein